LEMFLVHGYLLFTHTNKVWEPIKHATGIK
jgi:hypothetical protein